MFGPVRQPPAGAVEFPWRQSGAFRPTSGLQNSGRLAGTPSRRGKALRTRPRLLEHLVFETLPDSSDRLEAELGQSVTRPAPARIRRFLRGADLRRRFGDDHPGAHPQEGGATLGHHGGRTE